MEIAANWKFWAIAIIIVVAVALLFPWAAKTYARTSTESEIARLQEQLAAVSVSGGNPVEADQLRARIRSLTATADNYGSALDLGEVTLSGCDAMRNRITSELQHYIQVSYSDPVQRENTRASMLAFGATLARCYSQAIADAESRSALDTIKRSIVASIADSEARRVQWESGAPGYDRYGVSEPHGYDKAAAERDQVQAPLRASLLAANAKIRIFA